MVGVIIVNYQNQQLTVRFIRDELSKLSDELCVVIVNNGATSYSDEELIVSLHAERVTIDSFHASTSCVYLLSSPENLGFAKANNLAVDFINRYLKCEYLLFANNDIIIQDSNVIQQLTGKLKGNVDIGMIGPQVVGVNGEKQSPFPYQSFWDRYVRMYAYTPFLTKVRKDERFQLNYPQKALEGFHYRIMGSFFMMRLADYKAIDGMDPTTFLYAEELILSERLKQIGKGVYYDPQVSVLHEHGATTRKSMTSSAVREEQLKSECYYYHQYINVPKWELFIGCQLYRWMQFVKCIFRKP